MTNPGERLRIAVTLGDPRGIGPEVCVAAAREFLGDNTECDLLLIGPPEMASAELEYEDTLPFDGTEAGAGHVSRMAIVRAVELAAQGEVAGIVTGPIHKPAFRAAGVPFPGHTEFLQHLTGSPRVGMLMCAETVAPQPLRILLATAHVALREVPDLVTADLLVDQATLLATSLRQEWGIAEPRVALCALNPHASDNQLFGTEEARVFEPAVERLGADGIQVVGPVPADTVFTRALSGDFDAVVAPYHDVGMAAFKTVSFGHGVNVTLGLPFVRTSPDHGTAFDLVGTGRARTSSTLEALRLAVRLARSRHRVAGVVH